MLYESGSKMADENDDDDNNDDDCVAPGDSINMRSIVAMESEATDGDERKVGMRARIFDRINKENTIRDIDDYRTDEERVNNAKWQKVADHIDEFCRLFVPTLYVVLL